MTPALRGADPELVEAAIERADPLPGTAGFAGEADGRLVRDVLGRYPLFSERGRPGRFSHDHRDLAEPQSFPAGHVATGSTTERVWTLPDPDPYTTDSAAVSAVRDALDTTLSAVGASPEATSPSARTDASLSAIDMSNLAVAFSGGVDSAVLAARLDAPLYVVGFPDSHDIEAATSGAAQLDRDVRVVELDHDTLEAAVPEVSRTIGRTNAMDVPIALGLALVARRVSADGFEALALGQGADELFGGYAKIATAPEDDRVAADTVRGARREVLTGLPDQLERDVLAVRDAGLRPVVPFLHDRVVAAALGLGGDHLVRDGTRKWALREAVRPWLPDPLVDREKKAMQYGSLVSRELDRLARQAGYKRRMDDHVRQYVESRR